MHGIRLLDRTDDQESKGSTEQMLKMTFFMMLGFVMVLLAFGYVNGGGKK